MSARSNTPLRGRAFGLLVVLSALLMVTGILGSVATAAPAPLMVTVSGSPNPVQSGASFTWTITAVNTEPDLHTVRLVDQLTGLKDIVLTSSRGYCTESNLLITCEGGSMPGHNEVWTVTIRGIVTAGNGEVLNNTATFTGRNGGQDFAVPVTSSVLVNNTSGPLADLSTSIIGPDSVAPGADFVYTLVVNNSGAANTHEVYVSATVPGGFTFNSVNGTSLFDCSASVEPTVTCTGGTVNGGANANIAINLKASATPTDPSAPYVTTATVDPENAIAESNDENNTTSHTLAIPAGPPPSEPMTLTKTAAAPAVDAPGCNPCGTQVRPGDQLIYTITATNTSTKWKASKLKITDGTQGLEAASLKVTSSDPRLICTPSASQVDCRAANDNYILDPGKTVVVTIEGTVVQNPSSIITNVATLQTLQNRISITRTAGVSTTVRPQFDLTVTQYSTCTLDPPAEGNYPSLLDCPPFRARNQFDYLITVGNSGLNDATGVLIREPLPAGVIFEGYDNLTPSGGFTCTVNAANVVTCTGGTIPGQLSTGSYPGTIRQLRFHLTAPNQAGPITSTLSADPFNSIKESDETNNTFTTTTPIETGIDLDTMQTIRCPRDTRDQTQFMCDPAAPSGTIIYDLIVTNSGTQDSTGIKVTDTLPEGSIFRSAKEVPNPFGSPYTPNHGLSCSSNDSAGVTCVGGHLLGIYAAYNNLPPSRTPPDAPGSPTLNTSGTPDSFTIEITAFAPAPFGPTDSPGATGSPILNQAFADPDNTIPEIDDLPGGGLPDNLNILETNVGIPPPGDWGTYNELTVVNEQTNPAVGSVAPNGTLEYTLTVNNFGSDPVSNITVYDYIPQGARFRDANGDALTAGNGGFQCSFDAGLVTCGNGALAASPSVGTPSSTKIHIKLFAPDTPNDQTSNYTNHSVVDPLNVVPEADETNNVSDVSLTVDVAPVGQNSYNQLTITNEQSWPTGGGAVAPNGTLRYRLTIGNVGTDLAQNVLVRDYLPEGTRFRSAKNNTTLSSAGSGMFACFENDGIVECANGTILGGGMAVIDITLFAPDQPTGSDPTIQNQAVVDPENAIPEGNEQDNTATADSTVAVGGMASFIELSVSALTDTPDPVTTDTPITYTLTVKNDGTDQAFNVAVEDHLPAETRFVSANDSAPNQQGSFTCSEAGGTVTCTGGSIPGGGSRDIVIVARSPRQSDVTFLNNQVNITNEAIVDPGNAIPEGDESNNTRTEDTKVLAAVDLTVTNDGTGCTGQSGNECNWLFTITNAGPDTVTDVVVETSLPIGTIPLDVQVTSDPTGTFWSCQIQENPINKVTCTGTEMVSGNTASFTVRVFVTANSGNTISSTTVADPADTIEETVETNNTAQSSTSA